MALELLQASTADALTITGIENYRKGYGVFLMQEIEALYPSAKEFTVDTPIWNIRTNAFYRKLGYTEVRRDNDFIYYSKDNLQDN
mgnify:CR=1 FL=1